MPFQIRMQFSKFMYIEMSYIILVSSELDL